VSEEPKEWMVDWTVEVDVTIIRRVRVGRSEIIEAGTAEEAVEKAKAEMWIEETDIEDGEVVSEDINMDAPHLDTFKTDGDVLEWSHE